MLVYIIALVLVCLYQHELPLSIAVLDESKNIVYILFGYQDTKAMVNTFKTVLAVNVTDISNISFVDTDQNLSTAAEQPTSAIGDEETTSKTPILSDNSNSTTIGAAVGSSLGVCFY